MKLLNLSLDNSILDNNSSSAKRIIEYGNLVEKYTVIVPNKENKKISLSEKVLAIGVGYAHKTMALFKIYKIVKKILNKEKYGVITVQDQYYLALIGFILSKKFKIGLEIQVHGFEKYYGLRKMIAKFVLPRADSIRVVSKRLKKQLINKFRVNEYKITVVPVYVNIKNYNLEIKNYKINDKFIFLTVGRLVSVKNIKMQINAMANIVKKLKSGKLKVKNLELWIVGDGKNSENLRNQSKKLKIEKNIKFFGWQNNLDKFYKQANVFLLTSNSEGWGMAVIEAGSYGLPIIMTDVGCAGEVIKDSESGIAIPIGDQKKLEEAMIKIIKDENLRKKLGENARQATINLPRKEQILELYKKSWKIKL